MDIPAQFIAHNSCFRTAETGGNKNSVSLNLLLNKGPCTGDGKFQVGTADFQTEIFIGFFDIV